MIKRLIKIITFPFAFAVMVLSMLPLCFIDVIIYIITGYFGNVTNNFFDLIYELYDN